MYVHLISKRKHFLLNAFQLCDEALFFGQLIPHSVVLEMYNLESH